MKKTLNLTIPDFNPVCYNTEDYMKKCSKYISESLNVPQVKLQLRIAENNKSDFGWCKKIDNKTYKISISEFIVGTPSEEYIIEHEVVHAYIDEYFPEAQTHGPNFTNISNALFFHDNLKRPWVRRYEDIEIEADFIKNKFIIFFDKKPKCIINIINGKEIIMNENMKPFKHKNTSTIYNNIFVQIMSLYKN